MGDRTKGLFNKYHVTRTDGKPVAWAFVLEDRDPLAVPALEAYAAAARAGGYGLLADNLGSKLAEIANEKGKRNG